jgi:hypothetical protein
MIHDDRNATIGGTCGAPILALVDVRVLDALIVAASASKTICAGSTGLQDEPCRKARLALVSPGTHTAAVRRA